MKISEKAVELMEAWAADNSHGYDQLKRWGPDYDCSSAVISAWEQAGLPVKSKGASYTGNMYAAFTACGFRDVTAEAELSDGGGLVRGDVLLNHRKHTAMYCGGGLMVEASINELGGIVGGQPGDQNGREFRVTQYRNYPWDCVLRYEGEEFKPAPAYWYSVRLPLLKAGISHGAVSVVQRLLDLPPGGLMDEATVRAVREYQKAAGLLSDGQVGGETWRALLAVK